MKYALIVDYLEHYSVVLMCRVMGVSKSGFYRWLDRPASLKDQRRMDMQERVKQTYEEFEAAYGAPRLAKELTELGYPCSVNYVAKSCQSKASGHVTEKAFAIRVIVWR